MRRIKILLVLGALVVILPYLGFPYVFKNILITLSGLLIIYLSYFLYKENKENKKEEKIGQNFENFSENGNFIEKEEEIK